jgi:hypothetical protein
MEKGVFPIYRIIPRVIVFLDCTTNYEGIPPAVDLRACVVASGPAQHEKKSVLGIVP